MLSIIIPVWSQGHKVRENFSELIAVLKKIRDEYEVIFVDDGSTDNTLSILQDIQKRYPQIKIIKQRHLGQHCALFAGFKQAQGDIIITMDADQKVGPKYIPDLLDEIGKGYDMVVAWRQKRPGIGRIRQWGSLLVNSYTNIITGKRLRDHACCLKAYRGQFVKDNLSRAELNRFFGILIARYAHSVSEIKATAGYKGPEDSSFSFKSLAFLSFEFILSSLHMLYSRK